MKFSIIICTYNRAIFLEATIKSILQNVNSKTYELLIIDNNSTDNTKEIIIGFKNTSTVKYFLETNQGLSHARNRGMKEANGEILLFLDDDIELQPDYFDVLSNAFGDTSVDILGGKVLPYKEGIPAWLPKKYFYLVSVFDIGDKKKTTQYVMGANYAMRRKVAEKVGLYNLELGRKGNNLMGGEETEFLDRARAKGFEAYYIPTLVVYHKINNKLNRDYVYEYAYHNGKSDAIKYKNVSKLKYILKYAKSIFVFTFSAFYKKSEYIKISRYNAIGFLSISKISR